MGSIPALTMVLTSLAGLPVRRIPRILPWWIRRGEIALLGVVLRVGLTLYSYVMGIRAIFSTRQHVHESGL
ncbi:hypothetical protein HAV21_10925 [Paenarthrobacter sp. MSM-2-10-13]|uniref:hypothetical protein n=1 Tax=Paenarthrobacter sp. MSM-2-10-13 TaxID=2717318 RepID=UPI00141F151A|nr:hypothetical protein [Paenarthrobacter sp. MSM-2-10-13]NHW47398.1 hypothetical protein [Paenarthrobacter sp. MSM-2-10-13]